MLLEYGCHSNSMVSAGFTRLKFASDFGIIVSIFFQRRSLSRSDNHVSTPEFRNYAAHAAHGPSRVKSRVQPCSSAAVQHAAKYQFQRPGFWSFHSNVMQRLGSSPVHAPGYWMLMFSCFELARYRFQHVSTGLVVD